VQRAREGATRGLWAPQATESGCGAEPHVSWLIQHYHWWASGTLTRAERQPTPLEVYTTRNATIIVHEARDELGEAVPSRATTQPPRPPSSRLVAALGRDLAPQVSGLAESTALAYKAYEIEELVDVYFYRRVGYLIARAAGVLHLSPNAVSILAAVVGMAGGALLASPALAPAGVGLLILHGAIDSADGQLARMTGQVSEFGRVLDGVSGYLTHVAVYLAIVALTVRQSGPWWMLGLVPVAGVCTAIQAQMYDYHRTAYAAFAIKGRVLVDASALTVRGWLGRLAAVYSASQRALLGRHGTVEETIASRAIGDVVRLDDREKYRACFYWPVRGWNLLGDNVRRFAIAAFVLLHHVEWFIVFTLVPMNLLLLALWWWQRRADRRFLAGG
jgi:phosphatidylglycerophosphate synthase